MHGRLFIEEAEETQKQFVDFFKSREDKKEYILLGPFPNISLEIQHRILNKDYLSKTITNLDFIAEDKKERVNEFLEENTIAYSDIKTQKLYYMLKDFD